MPDPSIGIGGMFPAHLSFLNPEPVVKFTSRESLSDSMIQQSRKSVLTFSSMLSPLMSSLALSQAVSHAVLKLGMIFGPEKTAGGDNGSVSGKSPETQDL